jgi:oligoribonuclease
MEIMTEKSDNNLIWIDMEMSGLNVEEDKILEIAVIVTDPDLKVIAEGPVLVVHQEDNILDKMDAWNTATHNNTLIRIRLPCVVIRFVRTGALWQNICLI